MCNKCKILRDSDNEVMFCYKCGARLPELIDGELYKFERLYTIETITMSTVDVKDEVIGTQTYEFKDVLVDKYNLTEDKCDFISELLDELVELIGNKNDGQYDIIDDERYW